MEKRTIIDTLEAQSLSVSMDKRKILKDINFKVREGEVFALLGGNGAGKSTTLKAFLGLVPIDAGAVRILGKSVEEHPEVVRQKVAYLPESVMLYEHLSAIENLEYFLSLAKVESSREKITKALERASLQSAAWEQRLSHYSKGMRQKTAIALALLRQTPVLLLDEPTSGLDPVAIDELNRLIRQLAQEGCSILMVTHDVYGACHVANRVALLRGGEIVGMFESKNGESIDTEDVHAAFAQGVNEKRPADTAGGAMV